MELSVFNSTGQDTGRKVVLSETVFGIEPNTHAMYLDVKQYLANQRQGTHKSKERNEVAGTTKKLKKQKGTGGARAGSMKSPVFIGGGRVFGPRPRNYSFKLNKKLKEVARLSALSTLARNNKVTLVVTAQKEDNVYLSSRNLQGVKVAEAINLNTYDLLNADTLLITEDSLKTLEQLYSTK
jgi:large subunit ribosomal protein L4